MRNPAAAFLCLLLTGACSRPGTDPTDPAEPGQAAKPAPSVAQQAAAAAATPLGDLNLVRAKIPPVLLAAQRAPYAPPLEPGCEGLAREIRQLDAALGEDLDVPPARPHTEREQGRMAADEAAVGAVRHAAEGLIPYRSWIRKLSGAERYSALVTSAVGAGVVRRAYLKGLGQAQGCQAPAAPRTAPPPPAEPAR
jgi:hypothetical protein